MKAKLVASQSFTLKSIANFLVVFVFSIPCNAAAQSAFFPRPLGEILGDLESNDSARIDAAVADLQLLGGGLGGFHRRIYFSDGQVNEVLKTENLVSRLGKLLDSTDRRVCAATLSMASWLGVAASDLSPKISSLINNSQCPVRELAFTTLCLVTPESKSVLENVSDLSKCLNFPGCYAIIDASDRTSVYPTPEVQSLIVYADMWGSVLRACGHTTSEVPVLLKFASTAPTSEERLFSLSVIASFGPEARGALPKLHELLADSEADLRRVCADAIIAIDRDRGNLKELADKMVLTADEREAFVTSANSFLDHFDDVATENRRKYDSSRTNCIQYWQERLSFGRGPDQREALREMLDVGEPIEELRMEIMMMKDTPDPDTKLLADAVIAQLDR